MRITILALGTRGDVQPYIALGLGLRRAGHEVRLVAFGQFKALVESRGLDFYSAGADTRKLADSHEDAGSVVLEALTQSGQRGVIATGWGGLSRSDLPEHVFALEAVPHDWLFPRMAAGVHHGGAGTTGAELRAGVPSIIVPFSKDQPFWARRVEELGVGPAPFPRKRLTAGRLAQAMRVAVTDESIRKRSAALGEAIRGENGVGNAVRVVNQAIGEGC